MMRAAIQLADQAQGLRVVRREASNVFRLRQPAGDRGTRIIAVTSGKGGVGKTQIAANLAVAMAQRGLKVALFDADLGLASLDLVLGLEPTQDLMAVLDGRLGIEDILLEGPEGVFLVPACPGRYEMANLNDRQRGFLSRAMHEVAQRFDLLITDTGAGIGSNAVTFAAAADEVLLVATPDPTSLRDAYAMAKVLHRRTGVDRIRLIANEVTSESQGAELHDRIDAIVRRFLTLELEYLGCVPRDENVRDAVAAGTPYVLRTPGSMAARAMVGLARRLDPTTSPREMC